MNWYNVELFYWSIKDLNWGDFKWFDYLFWVVSIIIIILSLLQGGKSEGASGAITGGGLNVFVKTKERGSELIISWLTLGFGIVFLFFALLTSVLTKSPTPAA
ncbi:MAG: preprotein translocase subunit SecG [Bacillales bacterium]